MARSTLSGGGPGPGGGQRVPVQSGRLLLRRPEASPGPAHASHSSINYKSTIDTNIPSVISFPKSGLHIESGFHPSFSNFTF